MSNRKNVLGVCGSLRAESLNLRFLRAMELLAPASVNYQIYPDLADLPLFNPDRDGCDDRAVSAWRAALARADIVLLASPEYALGVSGMMKNALDWIVGSGELTDKPIAFPNVSVRAVAAQQQLTTTLGLMGGNVLEACSPRASLDLPLVLPEASAQQLLDHAEISPRLQALWQQLLLA